MKLAVLDHCVIHSGSFSDPSLDNLVSFYQMLIMNFVAKKIDFVVKIM